LKLLTENSLFSRKKAEERVFEGVRGNFVPKSFPAKQSKKPNQNQNKGGEDFVVRNSSDIGGAS
jgi:hypothetical protein